MQQHLVFRIYGGPLCFAISSRSMKHCIGNGFPQDGNSCALQLEQLERSAPGELQRQSEVASDIGSAPGGCRPPSDRARSRALPAAQSQPR